MEEEELTLGKRDSHQAESSVKVLWEDPGEAKKFPHPEAAYRWVGLEKQEDCTWKHLGNTLSSVLLHQNHQEELLSMTKVKFRQKYKGMLQEMAGWTQGPPFSKLSNPSHRYTPAATTGRTSSPYGQESKFVNEQCTPLRELLKPTAHCVSKLQISMIKSRTGPEQSQKVLLFQHIFLTPLLTLTQHTDYLNLTVRDH